MTELVRSLRLLACIAALTMLAACNRGGSATQATSAAAQSNASAQPAPATEAGQPAAEQPAAKSVAQPQSLGTLTLPSGEQVPIVSVMQLDADAKAHVGLIALKGRVMVTYPERGEFVLLDAAMGTSRRASCGGDCMLPIQVALANYEGSLPTANTDIVVIANLSLEGQECRIDVREVRQGDKVILKQLATAR